MVRYEQDPADISCQTARGGVYCRLKPWTSVDGCWVAPPTSSRHLAALIVTQVSFVPDTAVNISVHCALPGFEVLWRNYCVSEGASRFRTSAKLQYEPCVTILQRGYDVCAAKYGRLGPTGTFGNHVFRTKPRAQRIARAIELLRNREASTTATLHESTWVGTNTGGPLYKKSFVCFSCNIHF